MVLVASKVRGGRVYGLQDEGSNRFNSSRNRGRGDSRTGHRTDSHVCDNREATVVFGSRCSDLRSSGGRKLTGINWRNPRRLRLMRSSSVVKEIPSKPLFQAYISLALVITLSQGR